MQTRYLRFAALGDSTTYGLGDPVPVTTSPTGWRGWARLLAGALAERHDVSFCNLAVPGATAADVRADQLDEALAHRPDLASLVVGVNDTMRSTWDPDRVRADLLATAAALRGAGALLLTARFHDHGAVLGLPGVLRRPMAARIATLNAAYDEVHAAHGGVRLDLAAVPGLAARGLWSVDRLHPSERGHRTLAAAYAAGLAGHGVEVEPPGLEPDGGLPPSRRRELAWVLAQGGPWVGRRARDLGPWAVRWAWTEARRPLAGAGRQVVP